jgi:multimeric flavodoxin WrbA
MDMKTIPPKRVIALVGSYRKGGVADAAVDEVLAAAREEGAETAKIYLIDRHIEFCTNCRTCTQAPDVPRGKCPLQDGMAALLDDISAHDALIIASPMNFFTVTAVTKRFIERLVCFAYWPWGMGAPKTRKSHSNKRAVIIISLAAPSIMVLPFSHIAKIMKTAAVLLGAPKPKVLWIGLAAMKEKTALSKRIKKKARRLGQSLVE